MPPQQASSTNPAQPHKHQAGLEMAQIQNESFFKITHHDVMRPFFMTIVSDANHWLYISSNGGLTAGRKNPEFALFPYYTDDKITESADLTGSKTLLQVHGKGETRLWEPFSPRQAGLFAVTRNLYKSMYGNQILFEEINNDLGLIFRYRWSSSKRFGFVRTAELVNTSDAEVAVNVLDGLQNIMPYGVPSEVQQSTSNLVDAYKRSELEPGTGLGMFALSAIIVDKAEPSEALKANVAWSVGFDKPVYLLSSLQLDNFRAGAPLVQETDVKGEKGAYFVSAEVKLPASGSKSWRIVAEVNQSQSQVIALCETLAGSTSLDDTITADIEAGTKALIQLVAAADGLQRSQDTLTDTRHFSNTLFNIMRGGIFDDHYQIELADFSAYLRKANSPLAARSASFLNGLGPMFSFFELKNALYQSQDPDLIRLGLEYLPLKFSRRHGDPSRPWNKFSINTQNETDGSKVLDYQGNWRDIFQNWEALAHAYPEFMTGMIFRFLNASTFDGYNPYRVTKGGFDWETIEPDDPWSYIGYWGDHQIIYLLKFLEFSEKYAPGSLRSLFEKDWFVYAAVPYLIKPYEQLLKTPQDTIDFDHHWDAAIRARREQIGADGALLALPNEEVYRVNFLEKILASVLAKVSNLIPEAGIWMNTQRPEWNDANNALVGNGVSMVTLYYLRRFMAFFQGLLGDGENGSVEISAELALCFHQMKGALAAHHGLLAGPLSDADRKAVLDSLGTAASDYRAGIYKQGFSGEKQAIDLGDFRAFSALCLDYLDHAIRANKRADKLYHAYNLMVQTSEGIGCAYLSEMLEGQVAVLSSGLLSPAEALDVLDGLKNSSLFRPDQYSYILYPNKQLPGFLQKNNIDPTEALRSELIKQMTGNGDGRIVERNIRGGFHFNGQFKNAKDLANGLDALAGSTYAGLAEKERQFLLDLYEKTFHHKAFTGRSGAFFAYEGLGSIYWHMVSKLLLAVQECCFAAMEQQADPAITGRLLDHYYEIGAGIGVHKSPELYGAFPTDAYSHTPLHRGAQQPGMTGQVKEDILTRFGELGVTVRGGKLTFGPRLLRKGAFLSEAGRFDYLTIQQQPARIDLPAGSLAFTCCQVPVVYQIGSSHQLTVQLADGKTVVVEGLELDADMSQHIFQRSGQVQQITVSLSPGILKD